MGPKMKLTELALVRACAIMTDVTSLMQPIFFMLNSAEHESSIALKYKISLNK